MIQSNELRKGNLILDPFNNIVEVEGFNKDEIYLTNRNGGFLSSFEPIVLTHDIITNVGFTMDFDTYFWQPHHENIHYRLYPMKEDGYVLSKGFINFNHELCIVRHLHTLQNIIISLTDQELEIELPVKKTTT